MPEPNSRQQALIESTEGIHLVDAGAGTGKTFALTRRYANIVDQGAVEPDDVLLVTFTNNAASEMKERAVTQSSYGMRDLRDAPIQTFHSRCHDLLLEHGFDAPTHLGIDDRITNATRIVDDDLIEAEEFRQFFDSFSDNNPEYEDFYRVVDSPESLLGLVNELAAKGVFPTADGWYRDGERYLDGDFEAFEALFTELNRPRNGGSKQSKLREKLSGYGRDDCHLPDAPERWQIRGDGKAVPPDVAERVFEEDREALKAFVHDVYFGYLEYTLSRNYLTFGMLQLYAYVLLCEAQSLREEIAFEYVMVDEFQDTSEIQFKLALLSCGSDNLCVVGDWKQSIYSFQYADIDNIRKFETRLERFAEELNADADRVHFDDWTVRGIELVENYRSTQELLDFSEEGLVVPATGSEDIEVESVREDVVSLSSNADHDHTHIEAIQHEDEHEALLTKVQAIVGNDEYSIEDEGDVRPPEMGDIAVLTRTKDFGRELLDTAQEYGIPMAYEGGIELFRTDQAKLLLAWLRILETDGERGWAVVLEQAGYTLDEIDHLLASEDYPGAMQAFKETLASLESVGAVAEAVFGRYGYDGIRADVVIETVQDAHDATTMTRGDLIRFIERGIEEGATQEVSAPAGTNAVTVQTIHAAKGLEYPIVVLANMNRHKFPSTGGGSPVVSYNDPIGLRQRKQYAEVNGYSHVFDNWRADVLRKCLPTEYDEERRLLYVAMTRAEHHLVFVAGEQPNTFLDELPIDVQELDPDIAETDTGETVQTALDISIPVPEGPEGWTPHQLMQDDVFEGVEGGEGTEFGSDVHDYAEAYAKGEDIEPGGEEPDWDHVREFIDELEGDLHVETSLTLPIEADGDRFTISGVADLVVVSPDSVRVVDFKTDRGRHGDDEYQKQLSVYYHAIAATFPERAVSATLFYTETGDAVEVDPFSTSELGTFLCRSRNESHVR